MASGRSLRSSNLNGPLPPGAHQGAPAGAAAADPRLAIMGPWRQRTPNTPPWRISQRERVHYGRSIHRDWREVIDPGDRQPPRAEPLE